MPQGLFVYNISKTEMKVMLMFADEIVKPASLCDSYTADLYEANQSPTIKVPWWSIHEWVCDC
jgi:hypothetical protein